jgi:malonyl CoA-acyl carrier protein transacylase
MKRFLLNEELTVLSEELERSIESSNIDSAEISQPLCTALQIALVNLLRSFCIKPMAVAGHSSGEIAAA